MFQPSISLTTSSQTLDIVSANLNLKINKSFYIYKFLTYMLQLPKYVWKSYNHGDIQTLFLKMQNWFTIKRMVVGFLILKNQCHFLY